MKTTRIIQLFIVFILLVSTQLCFAQNPDFAGKWKVDLDKSSTTGDIPKGFIPVALDVKTTDHAFMVTRYLDDGSVSYTESLNFDGTGSEAKLQNAIKKQIAFQWSADHKTFTTDNTYLDADGKLLKTMKEVHRLEDGGKLLHISATVVQDGVTNRLEEYFDKTDR